MLILFAAAQLAAAVPPASAPPATPFGQQQALGEEALGRATAREGQTANSTLTAESSGNSVSGEVQTGNASFADSSFQNTSGLTIVNANTGNNVAINAAMTVNIAIIPGQ